MTDKLPQVPTEAVDRPDGNFFGKLLNRYRRQKQQAIDDAKRKLFERHKVTFHNQNRYKIVTDRVVTPSGKEFIELRLYELIDGAVVTMQSDTTAVIDGGISNLMEFKK